MNRVTPEGFDVWGLFSKVVLLSMYVASMGISFLFFAQAMPNLLIPSNSIYAVYGPFVSGLVGVAFMEAAAVSWNHFLKRTKLNGGQTFIAYFGLGTAAGMSIMTTFAAVMLYIGTGTSEISDRVVSWATQDGVAIYIALQLFFVFLFLVVFSESGEPNRIANPFRKKGKNQNQQRNTTPQQIQGRGSTRPTQQANAAALQQAQRNAQSADRN